MRISKREEKKETESVNWICEGDKDDDMKKKHADILTSIMLLEWRYWARSRDDSTAMLNAFKHKYVKIGNPK